MFHFFHPLLPFYPEAASQLDDYLSSKQEELSTLEKQMLTTKQEASRSIAFDPDYLQRFKGHIHAVKSALVLIQRQLKELLPYINEEAFFPQKSFSFLGTAYYSHIDSQAYFLYSPLGYDAFFKKQMFSMIELHTDGKEKKIHRCLLGFTSEEILPRLHYPMDLQHDLEKFETMETIVASFEHAEYCRQCLLDYFGAADVLELYEIEQSHLLKYIGDPLVLLRTIQKKHNDNRVRLSLQSALPSPINKALVELIHVERRVTKQERLRNFWEEEQFADYTKQLQQTKRQLMETAGVSQEQLNHFMEQMPADFL